MAISFQNKRLTGAFEWYWIGDDAIGVMGEDGELDGELTQERYERWVDTGDIAELPIKDGEKPTRFKLSVLTGKQRRAVLDISESEGTFSAMRKAAAMALMGWDVKHPDGSPLKIERKRDNRGFECADDELMEKLDSNPELAGLVNAMGGAAMERSALGPK